MSDTPKVVTNNQPRDIVEAWELTDEERTEFDYLDWKKIEAGEDSASFFRYRGVTYDLGEFMADTGILKGSGLPEYLSSWDGYMFDSFFSAVVVRYVENYERVIVGTVLS